MPREELASGRTIGAQLCEALGLDPKRVTRLELAVEGPELLKVTVTRAVTSTQGLAVVQLLSQRYELVPIAGDACVQRTVRAGDSAPDACHP